MHPPNTAMDDLLGSDRLLSWRTSPSVTHVDAWKILILFYHELFLTLSAHMCTHRHTDTRTEREKNRENNETRLTLIQISTSDLRGTEDQCWTMLQTHTIWWGSHMYVTMTIRTVDKAMLFRTCLLLLCHTSRLSGLKVYSYLDKSWSDLSPRSGIWGG